MEPWEEMESRANAGSELDLDYHCAKCGASMVEIFATERPIGPTGIFRCLECDWTFDPTWEREP
jgi:rubredoxin